MYHLDMAQSHNSEFGWSVRRFREFVLGRHKVFILPDIPPLSRFLKRFHRATQWSCLEFFFGHACEDLQIEMAEDFSWATSRPSSAHKTDQLGELVPYKYGQPIDTLRWHRALSAMEQKHLKLAQGQDGIDAGAIIQVKDHPLRMKGLHSKAGMLHTVIKTSGLLFSNDAALDEPRWLSASELAQSQGFRTHPKYWKAGFEEKVCFMNYARVGRRSEVARGLIGNAMPVQLYLLHLCCQWKYYPDHASVSPQQSASMQVSRVVARSVAARVWDTEQRDEQQSQTQSLFFAIVSDKGLGNRSNASGSTYLNQSPQKKIRRQ